MRKSDTQFSTRRKSLIPLFFYSNCVCAFCCCCCKDHPGKCWDESRKVEIDVGARYQPPGICELWQCTKYNDQYTIDYKGYECNCLTVKLGKQYSIWISCFFFRPLEKQMRQNRRVWWIWYCARSVVATSVLLWKACSTQTPLMCQICKLLSSIVYSLWYPNFHIKEASIWWLTCTSSEYEKIVINLNAFIYIYLCVCIVYGNKTTSNSEWKLCLINSWIYHA